MPLYLAITCYCSSIWPTPVLLFCYHLLLYLAHSCFFLLFSTHIPFLTYTFSFIWPTHVPLFGQHLFFYFANTCSFIMPTCAPLFGNHLLFYFANISFIRTTHVILFCHHMLLYWANTCSLLFCVAHTYSFIGPAPTPFFGQYLLLFVCLFRQHPLRSLANIDSFHWVYFYNYFFLWLIQEIYCHPELS